MILIKRLNSILLIVLAWLLVNASTYLFFEYQENQLILAQGVDPDLVCKFKIISSQIATPIYSKDISVKSRLLCPEVLQLNAKYPLIVFLHGAGERGFDNVKHLKSLPQQMAESASMKRFPCFLLAPQCPPQMNWSSEAEFMNFSDTKKQAILLDLVYRLILEISAKHPVDTKRIYITGYSMGGYGTWRMISRYQNLFAAASPLCGGGDLRTVNRIVHIPLWVAHGDADQVVPVTESRKMIDALRMNGARPEYRELKGMKHDCWTITYKSANGMLTWLFQQKKDCPERE